jgi:hypothetical protein
MFFKHGGSLKQAALFEKSAQKLLTLGAWEQARSKRQSDAAVPEATGAKVFCGAFLQKSGYFL